MKKVLTEYMRLNKSRQVVKKALTTFNPEKSVIAWTGGKDSTLLLWIVRSICQKENFTLPNIVLINEGDMFPEIIQFTKDLAKKWKFKFETIVNIDVIKKVKGVGDMVEVKNLSQRNQNEIKKLGFDVESFRFEPESLIGNHLMKTVALHLYIEKTQTEAVYTGIRRDEQEARSKETFFSKRDNPPHTRIHPILHFSERNVWDTIIDNEIPVPNLYKEGYRSLGAKSTTTRVTDIPAWEQNLHETTERAGRQQDKEKIMKKLRGLGYM